jgi:hypothetical protein
MRNGNYANGGSKFEIIRERGKEVATQRPT